MSHFIKPINTLSWTKFPNVYATSKTDMLSTWAELVAMIRNPETHARKKLCPLLVMGTFGDKRTTSEEHPEKIGCLRNGDNMLTLTGLACDYDDEKMPMAEACETLNIWDCGGQVISDTSIGG